MASAMPERRTCFRPGWPPCVLSLQLPCAPAGQGAGLGTSFHADSPIFAGCGGRRARERRHHPPPVGKNACRQAQGQYRPGDGNGRGRGGLPQGTSGRTAAAGRIPGRGKLCGRSGAVAPVLDHRSRGRHHQFRAPHPPGGDVRGPVGGRPCGAGRGERAHDG